ncbi:cytochrome b/b6 domain-containing protein [Lysobacter yananisis]|uniref:Cytochrome b/b6 domain-containing protein n=1 Tax=Lysobacter yananisis TaxID=1003114 RepID=A0ABY9PCI3_9GAMM|nr:cytochrome b/b6 domain-containing protein [Lysobacter yananisis]WMT04669.1 cytochrome b/b6 domain-containing protein [Lysobacter yananisis]
MNRETATTIFWWPARVLHWLMAAMILAMLFVGAGLVASVSERHAWLLALHKPLGIAILLLAVLRLALRLRHRPPPLPRDLAPAVRLAAHASHWLLYALMLAMPLIGWAMLSAGGYPVELGAGVRLPPIAPFDPSWFAALRWLHRALAHALFALVLAHLGAALYHGLIRRDGVLRSMLWRQRSAPD